MLQNLEFLTREDPLWNSPLKENSNAVQILNGIIEENRIYLTLAEMMNLYRLVLRGNSVDGHMAELGVCKGGSAKLIARVMRTDKDLFLFDSFEGMPEVTPGIDTVVKGDMAHSYEDVCQFLKPFPNVSIIKGFFPETTQFLPSQNLKFSFVHLDADTYCSTLEGLKYFYPRMSAGGYILIHDYNSASCPGVRKAVDEFMANKSESIIELWNTQAAFSILKSQK